MSGRDQKGLTYGQVFILLLGFCLASVVIFLLGLWVGRDLTERRLLEEEPVVRVPLAVVTPTPEEGQPEAADVAFYQRLKQKAEERLIVQAPTAPPTVAEPQLPVAPSPAPSLQGWPTARAPQETRPPQRPTATSRPRFTPTVRVPARPQTEEWADAGWTVQVTATTDAAEARALVQRLRSRGYDAYMVQAPTREGVTWYRVRVGRFSPRDRAKAEELQRRLRSEGGMSGAFVTAQ